MCKRIAFASLLLLTVVGCATTDGYRQFYTPAAGFTPEKIAEVRAAPAPEDPRVVHAGRTDEKAAQEFARQGYQVIGYSSFTSGYTQNDDDAVEQAKKVGADLVVILGSEYAGSVTSTVPITTPTTTTSFTNATASAYGTGGSAVAFGNSTTTTYGTNTAYVPLTVNRYQYGAAYLVKVRYHLGVKGRELSDVERKELQTNRGVYVLTVVDGTPAYENDILPGDVITAMDGSPINDVTNFNEWLSARAGRTIEFAIIRQGKAMSKAVTLR